MRFEHLRDYSLLFLCIIMYHIIFKVECLLIYRVLTNIMDLKSTRENKKNKNNLTIIWCDVTVRREKKNELHNISSLSE